MASFIMDIQGDVAQVVDGMGNITEIPVSQLPDGAQPGQDFDIDLGGAGQTVDAGEDTGDSMDVESGGEVGGIAPPAQVRQAPTGPAARQQYAMQKIISLGWKPEQAAGVVGRFMQEAYPDLRTGAIGDAGISMGIGQWNKDRRQALVNFAKTGEYMGKKFGEPGRSPLDLDTQLEFWNTEIRNSPNERIALESLQAANSYEDASAAMMHYERPRGYTRSNPTRGHGYDNTVNNAASVLQGYDPNMKIDLPKSKGGNTSFAGVDETIDAPQTTVGGEDPKTSGGGLGFTPPDLSMLTAPDTTSDDRARQEGRGRIADIVSQGRIAPQQGLPIGSVFGDFFGRG